MPGCPADVGRTAIEAGEPYKEPQNLIAPKLGVP